jgi:hypothetical protein
MQLLALQMKTQTESVNNFRRCASDDYMPYVDAKAICRGLLFDKLQVAGLTTTE